MVKKAGKKIWAANPRFRLSHSRSAVSVKKSRLEIGHLEKWGERINRYTKSSLSNKSPAARAVSGEKGELNLLTALLSHAPQKRKKFFCDEIKPLRIFLPFSYGQKWRYSVRISSRGHIF